MDLCKYFTSRCMRHGFSSGCQGFMDLCKSSRLVAGDAEFYEHFPRYWRSIDSDNGCHSFNFQKKYSAATKLTVSFTFSGNYNTRHRSLILPISISDRLRFVQTRKCGNDAPNPACLHIIIAWVYRKVHIPRYFTYLINNMPRQLSISYAKLNSLPESFIRLFSLALNWSLTIFCLLKV